MKKQFYRFRSVSELRKECRSHGWKLDATWYHKGGDHVKIIFQHGRVSGDCLVNMFNGRFFGSIKSPVKKLFSSDSTTFDRAPWFRALLNTVYVPRPKRKPGELQCHKCGCTDSDCSGCIQRTGKPCFWVDSKTCSACAPAKQVRKVEAAAEKAAQQVVKAIERSSKRRRAA